MVDIYTKEAFFMVDIDTYRDKVEAIRKKHLLSRTELAAELGISYATWQRLMDKEKKSVFSYKTLKKIKKFIDKWEKR